jgi:hypothetical protein
MSTTNSGLWERLHRGLEKVAEEKHCADLPTVKMVISIIVSAGRDRDVCYLGSDQFLYHCYLAQMDSNAVSEMISRAWYVTDNNIQLTYTEEDIDDEEDDF